MKSKNSELISILTDNTSGSSEILLRFKNHLLNYYLKTDYLIKAIEVAKDQLRDFAAVRNFCSALLNVIKKNNPELVKLFIESSIEQQKNSIKRIYELNKNLFSEYKSVTTISFSKTLLELFRYWYKDFPDLKIYILESRPMLEGRLFAKELIQIGLNCYLIVDGMIKYALEKSDAVIIGADQILANGNAVNKVGSYPLAVCANELRKPFFVIATKEKFLRTKIFKPEEKNPSEVWKNKNRKIKIINHYFEEIPSKLITKILTN